MLHQSPARKQGFVGGGDCWKAVLVSAIVMILFITAAIAKKNFIDNWSTQDA